MSRTVQGKKPEGGVADHLQHGLHASQGGTGQVAGLGATQSFRTVQGAQEENPAALRRNPGVHKVRAVERKDRGYQQQDKTRHQEGVRVQKHTEHAGHDKAEMRVLRCQPSMGET